MIATPQPQDRVAVLRAQFDAQFADAPAVAGETGERFLVVGVGGERLLLRLADVTGLYVDRRIVAVPSTKPALLGITGLRGAILPVYALGAALGYPPGDATPRWLVTATSAPVAFAVARFERHAAIARDRIVPRGDADGARAFLREAAMVDRDTLPVVDLPSLAAQL